MKRLLIVLITLFFAFPQVVSAHSEGLVPFFKIDDKLPVEHPIFAENVSPQTLDIPQDISKERYLVNKQIKFFIDTQLLSQAYPEETLRQISYEWDFGDGTNATGVENNHTYTKMGTYIVRIYAAFKDTGVAPVLLQSVQIDVLPNKDYQLPNPEIKIKRVNIEDKKASLNMQRPIQFEAKLEKADGAVYLWDFGDGKKGKGEMIVHEYDSTVIAATPVLRVIDKNGFVSDRFVFLTNDANTSGFSFDTDLTGKIILGIQVLVLLIGGIWFVIVLRKNKSKKRKR